MNDEEPWDNVDMAGGTSLGQVNEAPNGHNGGHNGHKVEEEEALCLVPP